MRVHSFFSLGLGGSLYLQGAITIGTVYIVFQYNRMLERPLEDISRQLSNVQKSLASLKRVQEMFGIQSKIKDPAISPATSLPSRGGALGLKFEGVSFFYDDEENASSKVTKNTVNELHVLEGIDFEIAPGEVLGLLGRTGSGKTTLTRLLFRLYDPQSGSIRLGDDNRLLDLQEIPLAYLRDQIGMVTQTIELFHASVRDNLTFFDTTIPDEKILSVIRELGLSRWYHSLGAGLDTILESGGSGLSAGEAQLLAFARIFLKYPRMIVLDEASSRLDPVTEHLIEQAVDRLTQDRTALIIAHRLKTVQRADKIMILEKGKIVEFGSREKLASDPKSRFSQLLQTGMDEVLA